MIFVEPFLRRLEAGILSLGVLFRSPCFDGVEVWSQVSGKSVRFLLLAEQACGIGRHAMLGKRSGPL